MGRSKCCEKELGLKKGPWTPEEDKKLLNYIQLHGYGSWRTLPQYAGLQRCGKSCRLRWINYLRPDVKRGKFSSHEEKTIIQLHALLGNRWSTIASYLPNRTDNEIKNFWNTNIKKRLTKMGIDPTTHMPQKNSQCSTTEIKNAVNLNHMAQWETARLEAEARLARKPNQISSSLPFHTQFSFSTLATPSPSLLQPTSLVVANSDCIVAPNENVINQSSLLSAVNVPLHSTAGLSGNQLVDAYQEMVQKEKMVDYNYTSMYNVDTLGLIGDDNFGDYETCNDYWNSVLNLVDT